MNTELTSLAHRYKTASGAAYASGDDQLANRFREAARKLEALAAELPPLPVVTRGPPSGHG